MGTGGSGAAEPIGGAGGGTLGGAAGALLPSTFTEEWFADSTVSRRGELPVPSAYDRLSASAIVEQLEIYDPGRLVRCAVNDDPAYRAAVDELGGVTWGYPVTVLVDESQPDFRAGFESPSQYWVDTAMAASNGGEVEIEESDIVGISDESALFFSQEHGLLLVDLSGDAPVFDCATKLPGVVDKFYFYQWHLVVMSGTQYGSAARGSRLLHFDATDGDLRFVEAVDLGSGRVLDTRRFNDKLVVYTDLDLGDDLADPNAGAYEYYYIPPPRTAPCGCSGSATP
ncbi:MAG: hypothetical protein JW751_16935 [Polyangiaceae bacterium]|nr:hypothetical protein [Polyangiaceae bacterium]